MKVLKSIGFKDCLNYQFPQLAAPYYIKELSDRSATSHISQQT